MGQLKRDFLGKSELQPQMISIFLRFLAFPQSGDYRSNNSKSSTIGFYIFCLSDTPTEKLGEGKRLLPEIWKEISVSYVHFYTIVQIYIFLVFWKIDDFS